MAFKCPVRKEILRQKTAEMKKKKGTVPDIDIRKASEKQIKEYLPKGLSRRSGVPDGQTLFP